MNAPSMLLSPMIDFNLIKNVIFPMFHVHKNSKLNRFNYISIVANFRMLQFLGTSEDPPKDGNRNRPTELRNTQKRHTALAKSAWPSAMVSLAGFAALEQVRSQPGRVS